MRIAQMFGRDSKAADYSIPNISEQPPAKTLAEC